MEVLRLGACVDQRGGADGGFALMEAALHGHNAIVQLLLGHSATVDLQSNAGVTALMCAAGTQASATSAAETTRTLLSRRTRIYATEPVARL